MSRLNDFAGWFLLALVAIAPLPFGGNAPIFWVISGVCISMFAIAYQFAAMRGGEPLRVQVGEFQWLAGIWFMLCVWLVIQLLPLGALGGGFQYMSREGATFSATTLSLAPGSTFLMLIRMLSYGFVFFLAMQAGANETRAVRLLELVFWVIVAYGVFGLVQLTQLGDTILGMEKKFYLGVATGTFINRNSYATFLAVGVSIGVALFSRSAIIVRARNVRPFDVLFQNILLIAGIGLTLLALLATESRMGLFAAVMGGLIVGLLTLRWVRLKAFIAPVVIILSAAAVSIVIWASGQGLLERALELPGSSTTRMDIYRQVLDMISARPWVGYGGGAFAVGFPMFFGPPLSLNVLIDRAHSTYLTLFAELGVVAGALPLVIFATVFVRSLLKFMSRASVPLLASVGATVVVAVHSLVDFSMEMQANAYLLVIVIGLGFASTTLARR